MVLAELHQLVFAMLTAVSSTPVSDDAKMASIVGAWLKLRPERLKVPACMRSLLYDKPCALAVMFDITVTRTVAR